MNINEIKNKSIERYLESLGYKRDKRSTHKYIFFKSPFTNERTASFAVNLKNNTFNDYSSGLKGDIITLIQNLEKKSFKEIVSGIGSRHLCERTNTPVASLRVDKVKPLINRKLIDYLSIKRCINIDIAKIYCNEVHYSIGNRKYFAIGFKNNKGGYELRNSHWKGSTAPKSISSVLAGACQIGLPPEIQLESQTVNIFEGFMDFLSALTIYNTDKLKNTTHVLNSTVFADIVPISANYNIFTDNDSAGTDVMHSLSNKGCVNDLRKMFTGYKDLNECLVKNT